MLPTVASRMFCVSISQQAKCTVQNKHKSIPFIHTIMGPPQSIPYDPENVFAKILDGRMPSHKIFETESCIAILDAFPAVPGHSLLISKVPAVNIMDLSEQQAANVLKELPRLCRAVQQATGSDGVNVLHNGGAAAGQIVFHLHFHVVPRFSGDGLFSQFASSKSMIQPKEAAEILAKIQACL